MSRQQFAFVLTICIASVCLIQELSTAGEKSSIFIKGEKIEELWNSGTFTEGVAAGPDGRIYFSDISRSKDQKGRIMKFSPASGKTTVHSADSGNSNGLMFNRGGKLIACCGSNYGKMALCQVTAKGRVKVLVDKFEGKRLNSPNDLVIHPNGSIYFSDPRYIGPEPMELDHMSVYRLDKDGSVHRVTTDIEKPNGVMVSPDGKTLYVAETNNGSTNLQNRATAKPGRMTLNSFPINKDGSLGKKKVLADFGDQLGTDGMTVDTAGNIYAAVRSADRFGIRVYSPDGKEIASLATPVLPTNSCFGTGKEISTLYITAGTGLYRVKTNATGFHPALGK